jgi:hypothetical protein
VGVQVRAHGEELPGVVEGWSPARPSGSGWSARSAPRAPGQTAALYAGTRVLGRHDQCCASERDSVRRYRSMTSTGSIPTDA